MPLMPHRSRPRQERYTQPVTEPRPHHHLTARRRRMTDEHDFSGLRATFVNCTLKRSPEPSHTQGLVDASAGVMRKHGVEVTELRLVRHDVAPRLYPDMREHGWENDAWPDVYPGILASDILVVAGPIWLGDNSSVTKQLVE